MKIDLPKFANKADLYSFLVKRKEDIFEVKKSEIKKGDVFATSNPIALKTIANKSQLKADTVNELNRTIIGNTYYWTDSHEDVHLCNCFVTSIKQRCVNKIRDYYDHLNEPT